MTVLYIHQLCVDGREHRILDNVSFHLDEGEILGLAGGAQSGKSALRDALLGRGGAPSSGRILFGNQDIAPLAHADIAALAPGGIAWLAQLDAQSIAAVQALAPRVILVDPAAPGTDWSEALSEAGETGLKALNTVTGAAMIVTSRDPHALTPFCDGIAVMCGGRLVERTSMETVATAPVHPYRLALNAGRTESLTPPGAGCPFQKACEQAGDGCETAPADLQMVDIDRGSACVRWRQLRSSAEPPFTKRGPY